MDEILIEEKRYVSSKRAAKVTGYAKDYIGQLCREGRVPARLVGRSWYVLESAIHDHRFGNPEPKTEASEDILGATSKWESPHYEAAVPEMLPSVNRLREAAPSTTSEGEEEASQPLHESWKAWFDRVTDISTVQPVAATMEEESQEEVKEEPEEQVIEVAEGVSVPIHTVYELPPEDLLPRPVRRASTEEDEPMPEVTVAPMIREGKNSGFVRTIRFVSMTAAVLAIVLAMLGSGYFDEYILSNKQVGAIAGVALYNK